MANKVGECKYCNRPIYDNEKYKIINLNGERTIFHISCFRKLKKEAIDLAKKGFVNF